PRGGGFGWDNPSPPMPAPHRIALLLLLAFAAALIGAPAPAPAAERPNVLLILVDDLKPALGCYGDPLAKTPNLDRFAASGLRFDAAYCNQAVCAPSRFSLMLGSHSTSSGLYGLGSHLRKALPDAVTLPQHFAKHGGYRTESLGKIFHIGHGNFGDPASFSVPHFKDKVVEYRDPASKPEGRLTREEAMFQNQPAPPGGMNALPRGAAFESPDVPDDAYADGRVAAETIKRLHAAKERLAKEGTPFFIAAGFARPHLPFSAPQKYWDLHDPAKFRLAPNPDLPEGAPKVAGKRGGEIRNYFPVPDKGDPAQISDAVARQLIHGYYASASYVDAQIGKVLAALDDLGLTGNTVVVLWGDHGFHLGDLGIWTKHTNYEQANRIPILIRAPGVTAPGTATGQLAESVDLFPTLADLAGLPAPDGPQPIDGVSLAPVLRDPSRRVRDHAFHAYPNAKLGRAIRTERYRFVEWLGNDDPPERAELELYDYQNDPLESKNLAAALPDVVAAHQAILARYPPPVGRTYRQAAAQKPMTPPIAGREIAITATVETRGDQPAQGVVVAQGGREQGYALHFADGFPALDIRINGKVTRLRGEDQAQGRIELRATITEKELTLTAGEKTVRLASPGLIPVQPKDDLSVGEDTLSPAGDYPEGNAFNGKVLAHEVTALRPKGQKKILISTKNLKEH
ncbi:MAG: sulfatase, partial [Verrucomicrobiales bacterium]